MIIVDRTGQLCALHKDTTIQQNVAKFTKKEEIKVRFYAETKESNSKVFPVTN